MLMVAFVSFNGCVVESLDVHGSIGVVLPMFLSYHLMLVVF